MMTTIDGVLDLAGDYFDCGYNEGREGREVDAPDGVAQKTLIRLRAAIEQYAATALALARDARIAELEGANAALLQQAQIWKQEATTHRATVHEAYRACTGSTGEPGDWNGALPIRALAAERDDALEQLGKMRMCVNCGKLIDSALPKETVLPECIGEDGLSACLFNLTPLEAWQHWSRRAHELYIDGMGEPRTRYVRVSLNGSNHCVMHPSEGDAYLADAKAAGDESDYTVRDVWLSEREFEDLPEHEGF